MTSPMATGVWPNSSSASASPSTSTRPLGSRNPFRDEASVEGERSTTGLMQHATGQSQSPATSSQQASAPSQNPLEQQTGVDSAAAQQSRTDDLATAMAAARLDDSAPAEPSSSSSTSTLTDSSFLPLAQLRQSHEPATRGHDTFQPPSAPPPSLPTRSHSQYSSPSHPPPPQHHSRTYQPPFHPPSQPHIPHRPRSPPRVNRAQDAGEANDDALGEAPPAYEDVLRAPEGMALPPQTRLQQEEREQQFLQQQAAAGPSTRPEAMHHSPPIRSPPPTGGSGSYGGGAGPPHFGSPPHQPYQHQQHQQGWGGSYQPHHSSYNPYQSAYQPYHQPPFSPHGHAQPARPLVVQPGDPRIGGYLCWKCNGTGAKTSWFWGDEGPCSACRGMGRIL